jgi:ComF family protein
MAKSLTVDFLTDFLSLFFPNTCAGCMGPLAKGENMICTTCILEMPQTNQHLDTANSLYQRLSYRMQIEQAMALFKFSKSSRVQQILHSLKYKNQPEIGVVLGKVFGEKIRMAGTLHVDAILPVPLHPARKRVRGYNQSDVFAEGLSEKLEVPALDNVLERKVKTETQTRKTKLRRWQNVSEVFHVKKPELIAGKKILLVDDVITTGATLEACAQTLLDTGCASVSIACLAEA